jgi:hypothetical protein
LSSELRQINGVPSVACERWIASDSSQISTSAGDRFEITPMPCKGIISLLATHCGHHARNVFRPRKTSNESVSIVIFVCFAITLALTCPARPLVDRAFVVELDGSLHEQRAEVFSKVVIISDDFSRSYKQQKTKRFLRKRLTGLGWFFNGRFCDVTLWQGRPHQGLSRSHALWFCRSSMARSWSRYSDDRERRSEDQATL